MREARQPWKLNAKNDLWLHPELFFKSIMQVISTIGRFGCEVYIRKEYYIKVTFSEYDRLCLY